MRKKIFAKIDLNFSALPIAYYKRSNKNIPMRIDGPEGILVQTTGGVLTGFDYENLIHAYHYLGEENGTRACRFPLSEFREIRGLKKSGWINQKIIKSFERQHAIIFWIGEYHDHLAGVNYPITHLHLWEEVHFPEKEEEDRRSILTPPVEFLNNIDACYFKHLDLTRRDRLPDFITRRLYDVMMKHLTLKPDAYFTICYLAHVIPLLDSNPDRLKAKIFYHLDLLGKAGEIDRWKLLRPGDKDDYRLPKDTEPTIKVWRKKRDSTYVNYEGIRQLDAKINREKKGK